MLLFKEQMVTVARGLQCTGWGSLLVVGIGRLNLFENDGLRANTAYLCGVDLVLYARQSTTQPSVVFSRSLFTDIPKEVLSCSCC
jgi:hypothetical protein